MKKLKISRFLFPLCLTFFLSPMLAQGKEKEPDWRLGIQCWSFNRYTLFEAIDKTEALGLHYLEAYPGQSLSPKEPKIQFGPDMPEKYRKIVKKKLAKADVKLINFGVQGLPNMEAISRKVFEFAKDMGIETIVSEPAAPAMDLVEKLCEEYQINVAIHNHPKPSKYWDPQVVLDACEGRSSRIGACADTGHWLRSGLDPVECLKKLEGRIVSLHFKDIAEGHDVIWGTGDCDVKAMLEELDRQGFKGVFSVEYEYNWENSVPEIKESAVFFQKVAGELGHMPKPATP